MEARLGVGEKLLLWFREIYNQADETAKDGRGTEGPGAESWVEDWLGIRGWVVRYRSGWMNKVPMECQVSIDNLFSSRITHQGFSPSVRKTVPFPR